MRRSRGKNVTHYTLVNELVEAKHANQLSRVLGRWSRYELIVSTNWGTFRCWLR
ncbi:MAG TPA: hypothetical protein VE999_07255 [Gemmataceae bacterium]|nr:hypothetical protein [Gemmataceae bacterium]